MVRLHITFLHFTARNRCGAYNPVTPDISLWLVRTKTTVLKIVTLLAKLTPDLFKLTWIGPTTHSLHGFTNYTKAHYLQSYTDQCTIPNCHSCQRI